MLNTFFDHRTRFKYLITWLFIFLILILFWNCTSTRPEPAEEKVFTVQREIISQTGETLFDLSLVHLPISGAVQTAGESASGITTVVAAADPASAGYRFYIHQSGQVEIRFYDFSDNYLTTLFSGRLMEGMYELDFGRIKIDSGAYLLKLSFNDHITSRTIELNQ